MWVRLSAWLYKVSSGWMAISGIVIFLLFTAFVLPAQTSRQESQIGDVATPDLAFYYTANDLYDMADAYGEPGREEYIRVRFTFDFIWPLVYTFFLVTSISWLFARTFGENSKWHLANLVPILGLLFDYLENIATSLVMARYPTQTPVVSDLAGIFTILKWVFIGGSFVLLFSGILVFFWGWIFRSRKQVDEN